MIETIGVFASVLVLISMCFNPKTARGNLLMRILNFIGSIVFVYYGIKISSVSVILLNVVMTVVNFWYITIILKQDKDNLQK